jgi:putative RNA 2'-phosphotransferase
MTDRNKTGMGKFLALILRHKPEVIGIKLDEHGWASVEELIKGVNRNSRRSLDRATLEEIVRTDSKQRYAFNADHTKIRANQGHSVHVDVELEQRTPPDLLWHGTGEKSAASIAREGILPMGRLYVHLSADYGTAVKVGSRHGRPVVFAVDCAAMVREGYRFWLSKNNVWLTENVPPRYLKRDGTDD